METFEKEHEAITLIIDKSFQGEWTISDSFISAGDHHIQVHGESNSELYNNLYYIMSVRPEKTRPLFEELFNLKKFDAHLRGAADEIQPTESDLHNKEKVHGIFGRLSDSIDYDVEDVENPISDNDLKSILKLGKKARHGDWVVGENKLTVYSGENLIASTESDDEESRSTIACIALLSPQRMNVWGKELKNLRGVYGRMYKILKKIS